MSKRLLLCGIAVLWAGCDVSTQQVTDPDSGLSASTDSGVATDTDGGVTDAGTADAGPLDAGSADAGPSDGGVDGGLADAGSDGGTGDAGVPGVQCGAAFCVPGEVCCAESTGGGLTTYCATSCASDGGLTLACDGQEDCGGNDHCCANLSFGPGNIPCPIAGGNSSCQSSCTTNIPFACNTQATAVLCQTKAQCAAHAPYSECCAFSQGGATTQLCATTLMAYTAQGCLP